MEYDCIFVLISNLIRYDCIGDVRGCGLMQSLEIVNNKEERVPSPEAAVEVMMGMKQRQVLVQITGRDRNVILITPPMCFNIENCQFFCEALVETLSNLSKNPITFEESEDQEELEFKKPGGKRIRMEDLNVEESFEYDALCEMD